MNNVKSRYCRRGGGKGGIEVIELNFDINLALNGKASGKEVNDQNALEVQYE